MLEKLEDYSSLNTVPSQDSVSKVAEFLEDQMVSAGVSMKIVFKFNTAIDEMYANIVRYSGATKVNVLCAVSTDKIVIIFRDNGTPFNPLLQKEPDTSLSLLERKPGGLGIFMSRKLLSDMSYRYVDNLNELTMTMLL